MKNGIQPACYANCQIAIAKMCLISTVYRPMLSGNHFLFMQPFLFDITQPERHTNRIEKTHWTNILNAILGKIPHRNLIVELVRNFYWERCLFLLFFFISLGFQSHRRRWRRWNAFFFLVILTLFRPIHFSHVGTYRRRSNRFLWIFDF